MVNTEGYPEQEEILYCFKIVEKPDSIEVEKYEINRWKLVPMSAWRNRYLFNGKDINSSYKHDSIQTSKLDRVVNKKLFTFNPSTEDAEKVITEYFKVCAYDAQIELNRAEKRLHLWRDRNNGEEI